jgi:hypothetical protein
MRLVYLHLPETYGEFVCRKEEAALRWQRPGEEADWRSVAREESAVIRRRVHMRYVDRVHQRRRRAESCDNLTLVEINLALIL